MQNIISYIKLAFISLGLISVSFSAIAQTNNALPAIITFILESNTAPVNTVPTQTLQLDIADMGELLFTPVSVSVNDADGNLSSIRVTSTVGSLIAVADDNVTLDDGDALNDFTITGSQENLMSSISTLIFSPLSGAGIYTITILSTDSDGESDQDIITLDIIDSTL